MELRTVIRSRRMVRGFDPGRPVPDDVLTEVLEHAVRAPSAGFSQGWDFVVLRGDDREPFWTATTSPGEEADRWLTGIRAAPVLIVCCSDPQRYLARYAEPDKGWTDRSEDNWPVPYWDVDTGMAAMLMLLTGVDHGLGALFFGVPAPAHPAVREALAIPEDRRIVGVLALGHPVPHPKSPSLRRGRRRLDEVVHWGRF